jgi:TonB-linked SusC/RagA family outer membrane protein
METFAQSKVTGTVNDEKGKALPGVTVKVKGGTVGTITDVSGNFSLTVSGNGILVFSFVGYASQEVSINGRSTVDVQMQLSSGSLSEVVVLAYGSQSKRDITGAVQTVNAKDLADIPVAQITQKLEGKLAGVEISQTTGTPGGGITVRIRGSASLSATNAPLYVVDGFPIVGDISSINPDEIETITVLKDAASTSLYGSRAANGVILVTTKHAKAGQTTVSASLYAGAQQVPQQGRPDMMDAQQFATFQNQVAATNGTPVNPVYANPSSLGKGTDWYSAMLRVAPIQNYSVNINSSKDKFSTSVTAGYFRQDGVLLNSSFSRYSLRANSDYQATKNVKIGFNIAPSFSVNNAAPSDGTWYTGTALLQGAILTSPLLPYKNPDGSIPPLATAPNALPNPNFYNVINVLKHKSNLNHTLANGYVEIKPIDGLTLKSSINMDLNQTTFNSFNPTTAGRVLAPPPQPASGEYDNSLYYSWLWENTAAYKKSVGKHNFEALLGYTAQKYTLQSANSSASNYPDDLIQTFNAARTTVTTSDQQSWSLLSYIARLNYNFDNKYLLTAAIRRDGSSRFGENNKYGNFPSVSAGWIVSDEDFMSNIKKTVSNLKLRASYGVVGNNNIGNYTQYGLVGTTNYPFNEVVNSGRSPTSVGNTELGWENTKEFDLGADIGLFSDRINVSYDYYNKTTDHLLYAVNTPISSGFASQESNTGKLNFWGSEINIDTKNLVGDFKWSSNFNISFNSSKVLSLPNNNAPIYSGNNVTMVGQPVGMFWGMEWLGVNKNQQDFNSSPQYVGAQVGTIKFKDVNGDGVVTFDNRDRALLGNPTPKFIFGFSNNFAYKNFDLTIVMSGQYGNHIANMIEQFTTNLDGVFNVQKDVANRWMSPSDPGAGRYGTTKAGTTSYERDNFSSRFLYDGSYLAIKNLTLGYTVPLRNTKTFHSLRFYTSIQQLYTFTNYPGANPEVSAALNGTAATVLSLGNDYTSYPVPRTYTFGINANF